MIIVLVYVVDIIRVCFEFVLLVICAQKRYDEYGYMGKKQKEGIINFNDNKLSWESMRIRRKNNGNGPMNKFRIKLQCKILYNLLFI